MAELHYDLHELVAFLLLCASPSKKILKIILYASSGIMINITQAEFIIIYWLLLHPVFLLI